MKENEKKELMGNMRKKRLKKYALTALALVIVVSVAVGFKLEDRDAKLPDGQGEIVLATRRLRTAGIRISKTQIRAKTRPRRRIKHRPPRTRRRQSLPKNIPKRRRRSWMPRTSRWITAMTSLPPMTAIAH